MTGDLIQIHDERVIEVKTELNPLEEEGYIVGGKAVLEEQIANKVKVRVAKNNQMFSTPPFSTAEGKIYKY